MEVIIPSISVKAIPLICRRVNRVLLDDDSFWKTIWSMSEDDDCRQKERVLDKGKMWILVIVRSSMGKIDHEGAHL